MANFTPLRFFGTSHPQKNLIFVPMTYFLRRYWFLGVFLVLGARAHAQLDSIHWIPPMHARTETGPQYLYLSTPEQDPFTVNIRDPSGLVFDAVEISNAQPVAFYIGGIDNTRILVRADSLLKPLSTKGIVLQADKKFYANFRYHSDSRFQASDLTCKGRSALGRVFRIGHFFQSTSTSNGRSNFVGVLATEDSTRVKLTAADLAVMLQTSGGGVATGPFEVFLRKGQSVVFSQYVNNSATQPPNGLIGGLLEASKPVAVNTGSWLGAPVNGSNDCGIDQIVPIEQVGKEYILCKGNGADDMETPLVVAHVNNTRVWVNNNPTPKATLQAGQFVRLFGTDYGPGENLYIQTSEPAYVYQVIGGVQTGNDIYRTGGLIFVPPVSCGIPNAVDNIYLPNKIGDITFDGGLTVVAMKDSTVTVRIDGNVVSMGSPNPVLGNPDFVTYRNLSLFDVANPPQTASVVAKGAIQVAVIGRNGAAGFGGFYSGFSKTLRPNLSLSTIGDGVCPDTLVATGKFDGVQWYYADSLMFYGPDTFYVAYVPGQYIARGYLGVCRRTDFVEDTIAAVFNSPEFPYTFEEPSCYGFSDGQISVGQPRGGLEPYAYSINKGKSYAQNPLFAGLAAGHYDVVVRDSTGCYNRPLDLDIGQPDSFTVDLVRIRPEGPLAPGDPVYLDAVPSRDVNRTDWTPEPIGDCLTCPQQTFRPEETTLYVATVYDDQGCPATDSLLVAVLPKVFSPNVLLHGSTLANDRFTLFTKEPLPMPYLRIFDRWGDLVFEKTQLTTNDTAAGWDGNRPNGREVPPGVYVFKAAVEYVPGQVVYMEGDVTVVR